MAAELTYREEAAAGYDRAFGHVTAQFARYLLDAARLRPGMQVLDVATGTGLVAGEALAVVGDSGHVTAADLSPAMAARARERLCLAANAVVGVEDGQALSFADASFNAVVCSLGLMFFPDPLRGLREFHRVLRPGGHAAVSVNTTPELSYNNHITIAIARHVPSLATAAARVFTIGEPSKLRSLFEGAGFREIEISTHSHSFVLPSFDAYFEPFEKGAGSPGQAFVSLSAAARSAVREEIRQALGDSGGPISINVEYRFASGRR